MEIHIPLNKETGPKQKNNENEHFAFDKNIMPTNFSRSGWVTINLQRTAVRKKIHLRWTEDKTLVIVIHRKNIISPPCLKHYSLFRRQTESSRLIDHSMPEIKQGYEMRHLFVMLQTLASYLTIIFNQLFHNQISDVAIR